MNNLIIWSKDRACQLDLLLRSIELNAADLFSDIKVIYKASNEAFTEGYFKIMEDHNYPALSLCNQGNISFNDVTVNLVGDCNDDTNVCFSTDDNVIYRKVTGNIGRLNYGQCFSLRLGLNTIVQNHNIGQLQPPLNIYIHELDKLYWRPEWYHPHSNYGYPWALDMHIYNSYQVKRTLERFKFNNTNELESNLFKFRGEITELQSFEQSVCVNIPFTNISGITQSDNHSLDKLNEEYLAGKRISLDYISRQPVQGCHQSFTLEWEHE